MKRRMTAASLSLTARLWLALGWLLKRLLGITFLLALALLGVFAWFVLWPVATVPPLEPVDELVYLDQGWDEDDRQTYYYTPQGTSMPQGASRGALRYDWFVNLRLPFSDQRFADPEHLRRYRFLVDPVATAKNPDRLPVGFSRHFDTEVGADMLDISCAACHNGELHFSRDGRTFAMRVDGGQAMHALTDSSRGQFAPMLLASLAWTAINPFKFDQFARDVLGSRYPEAKSALRSSLWTSLRHFASDPQNNPLNHLYPVEEGYGRTDALGRIGNTVFGDHLVQSNLQVGSAPVSYPYLWNIWKFDWVQYNGSVSQPLARNIGEALGVGARIPLLSETGTPLPPDERFRSSVRVPDLVKIEGTLQRLQPPAWPEAILGAVDRGLATTGRALFVEHCQGCHGPHVASAARQQANAPLKPLPGMEWRIEVIPVAHIGTDSAAADAFLERRYDLSTTGLQDADIDAALRPQLYRQLAREVRYRLTEVIRLRAAGGLMLGTLPSLLAEYPAETAEAKLPQTQFTAIRAALQALPESLPSIPDAGTAPPDPLECGLDCQTVALLWNLNHGRSYADTALAGLDVTRLTEGEALNVAGILIKNRYFRDYNIGFEQQQCIEGFGTLDLPQQIEGYKPRPLSGVWATPPFLHNGSVPNIYQLLSPPESRDRRFLVGSRQYDPERLGYLVISDRDATGEERGFWFDTRLEGNGNGGHAFVADPGIWAQHLASPDSYPLPGGVIGPLLSHHQKMALIEYLKIHRDGPDTPADFRASNCGLTGL
ncbi:MAG: cytochrome c [Oceanospirillaceae bacterium]|nr:cytochrome c [Oceanospirillaceae bacterium]